MSLISILLGNPVPQGFVAPEDSGDGSGDLLLQFDAVMEEIPTFSAKPTENAVENGSVISDHVTDLPIKLTLKGIVSNSPVSDRTELTVRGSNPAKDAYESMKRLIKAGEPFDVVTGFDIYLSMVITLLTTPRTASNGNSLIFDCQLQQVRVVDSELVSAPAFKIASGAKEGGSSKEDLGKQGTKAASEKATNDASLLFKLFSKATE